jgi:hypothetical protein
MSQPTRPAGDYEDLLRRALHSAVDPIEPADDGLERIRARLTVPDPLPVAWVVAVYAEVAGRARGGLQSALAWLRSAPQRLMPGPSQPSGQAPERYGVAPPATPGRPRFGRARLAGVVAAITLIMAMSVSAVTPFGQQMWAQAASALRNAIGAAPTGIGAGNGQGAGQTGAGGSGNGQQAGAGAVAARSGSNHGQPAASCPSPTPVVAAPAASPASSASSASPSPDASASTSGPPSTVSPSPAGSSSAVSPGPTSVSQASPGATPSTRVLAGAGQTGARRASVDVTGQSSDPCASPTQRPAQSTPSPTPRPGPSTPPGTTLGPSTPPATSPPPSSTPSVSPSPSSAGAASTAPATTSPATPAASSESDPSSASGSADAEGS